MPTITCVLLRWAWLQDAAAIMRQEMSSAVQDVCASIAAQLTALGSNQQQLDDNSTAVLGQLQVVLHLVTSPFFRPAVVDGVLVQTMAEFLLALPAEGAGGDGAAISEFRSTLLHVLEALSQVGLWYVA